MRTHLGQLDDVGLQAVKRFFEGNAVYGDWERIVREVEVLLAGDRGVQEQVSSSSGWRGQAMQALRVAVDPQELEWTTGVAVSDAVFAARGLQVLKNSRHR